MAAWRAYADAAMAAAAAEEEKAGGQEQLEVLNLLANEEA